MVRDGIVKVPRRYLEKLLVKKPKGRNVSSASVCIEPRKFKILFRLLEFYLPLSGIRKLDRDGPVGKLNILHLSNKVIKDIHFSCLTCHPRRITLHPSR